MTLSAKQASATSSARLNPIGTNVNKRNGQQPQPLPERSQTSGKLRPIPGRSCQSCCHRRPPASSKRSALFDGSARRVIHLPFQLSLNASTPRTGYTPCLLVILRTPLKNCYIRLPSCHPVLNRKSHLISVANAGMCSLLPNCSPNSLPRNS